MFTEQTKQLREDFQMPQRKLAAALEIGTATCCKIEKGERYAKREQILISAELLKADKDDLLSLCFADQATVVVLTDEQRVANKALEIAKETI
jgi:DNA-binding XRE family transcriptional regulator